MSRTIEDHKKDIACRRSLLRVGSEVRLVGWQMHWPRVTAKILSIDTARENVILDKPILGKRAWLISDLAKPF